MCSFLHPRLHQPPHVIAKVCNTFFYPLVSVTFHSNSAHFVSHCQETETQLSHLTFVTLWLLKSGSQIAKCFSYLYLQPVALTEDTVVPQNLFTPISHFLSLQTLPTSSVSQESSGIAKSLSLGTRADQALVNPLGSQVLDRIYKSPNPG